MLEILDRFYRIFNSDSTPAAAAARFSTSRRIMEKLQLAKVGCVRYAECERNHAVKEGGSAVDGCKEFIASDENGGSPLTCSCCGCHRNYHRRVEETDQENIGVGEQKKRKRRELKSKVWDDFTRFIDEDGNEWAICKHCKEQFDGSSKNGTTHLNNHLKSMKCRAKRNGGDGNEDVSTQIRDLATLTPVVMKEKPFVIDEDVSTQIRDLATLTHVVMKEKSSVIDLIKQSFDEYRRPTEHREPSLMYQEKMEKYDKFLSKLSCRKDEILQVYQEEKEKLGEFLNKLSCRFSLDIHLVCDNFILMVHYIDESWKWQMRIISIIPPENYIQEMKKACLNLKIDRNMCSIYYDIMPPNDDIMTANDEEIIQSWFSERGSLPFVGVGLDFRHFCEKVEFCTEEWEMYKIDGLRECVEYGYKTSSNNVKLQHAVNNAKTMGKKVIFNYHLISPFDTPLQYLELAVGLKEAFSELEKIDSDFINLTNQKWDEVIVMLEHFLVFKEFVESFCWDNCSCITRTVVDILKLFRFHEDCQVCKSASYKNLFDKIQVYLVLVILDPRFKIDTIQRCYEEIYGNDADGYLEKTLKDFRDVYNEYAKESSGEDYKMMDAMGRPCTSSTKSTELDLYLHHLKVPAVEGFDILAWWRGNAPFYPTLSRMARDYLAIPFGIDSSFREEIHDIRCCPEFDEGIKYALMYLIGGLR